MSPSPEVAEMLARYDAVVRAAKKIRKLVQNGSLRCPVCGADVMSSRAAGSKKFVHFARCEIATFDHCVKRLNEVR